MFENIGIETVLQSFQTESMRWLLPFLLVFVLLYGILDMVKVFDDNKINGALSIILSVIVIGYTPMVEGIFYKYVTQLFGGISVLLLSILAFFILTGFIMSPADDEKGLKAIMNKYGKPIIGVVAGIILLMGLNYGVLGALGIELNITFGELAPFLVLGGVVGFMGWVVRDKDGKKTKEDEKEDK